MTERSHAPSISVIVPGFNASTTIGRCLDAILAELDDGDEVVYVDDGSTDDTVDVVRRRSASRLRVVVSPTNVGRGPVRNLGARAANGDVLVFVDADVVVNPGALSRIKEAFSDSGNEVLFGSYDDHPDVVGRIGQYRNLLHHFTHHKSGDVASHFWTGLGAIRRTLFWDIGGFDETRWSRNMEEVEFGHRLTRRGHSIRVRPDIQGTHLKDYTIASMVKTDLLARAIPWTRLLLSDRQIDRFVLSPMQRLSAIGAALLFAAVLDVIFSLSWAAALAALGAVMFLIANWRLGRFLIRKRGLLFGFLAAPLHLLHTWVAIAGFVIGSGLHVASSLLGRKSTRQRC